MKTRCSFRFFSLLGVVLCASLTASADPFSFDTVPASGAITGAPGETVGWGFTVTNPSATLWLALTSVSADVFLNGTPDASIFFPPAVAPGDTLAEPYDALSLTGLFQFTWDSSAPIGFTNSGKFVVSGDFFDDDPVAGGNFVAAADDQAAPYSVTTVVPEPSAWLLLVTVLSGLALRMQPNAKREGECKGGKR